MKITYAFLLLLLAGSSLTLAYTRRRSHDYQIKNMPKQLPPEKVGPTKSNEPRITYEQNMGGLEFIDLFVLNEQGVEYALRLSSNMDGNDIKRLIHKKWGYPREQQTLKLVNSKSAYDGPEITNTDTIKRTLRKAGGRPPIRMKVIIKETSQTT